MVEDQSSKLYETLIDKINNRFVKTPVVSAVVISLLVSLTMLVMSRGYTKGEVKVELEQQDTASVLAAESANKEIQVDLSGAVKTPGVYTLPAQSRLNDLLALCGGFLGEASSIWVSRNLNLSQKLVDGDKIYIPFDWDIALLTSTEGELQPLGLGVLKASEQEVSKPATLASTTSVNVNTASTSDLDLLPGIGPAYAGRIAENRPYTSFEDFKARSGLAAGLADSLENLIVF